VYAKEILLTMTGKERLARQICGQEIDRVPCIGGWFHGVRNLAALVNERVKADINRT